MGQGRQEIGELYCGLHRAVALLRDEVEGRRRRHQETAGARFGLKAERAAVAAMEAEWAIGRLDALLANFAPERMGVPPWTA